MVTFACERWVLTGTFLFIDGSRAPRARAHRPVFHRRSRTARNATTFAHRHNAFWGAVLSPFHRSRDIYTASQPLTVPRKSVRVLSNAVSAVSLTLTIRGCLSNLVRLSGFTSMGFRTFRCGLTPLHSHHGTRTTIGLRAYFRAVIRDSGIECRTRHRHIGYRCLAEHAVSENSTSLGLRDFRANPGSSRDLRPRLVRVSGTSGITGTIRKLRMRQRSVSRDRERELPGRQFSSQRDKPT